MRLNVVLYGVVVALACAVVAGGVFASLAHRYRADAAVEQVRYGEVQRAAIAEAEAFVNIDYRTAQESFDRVAAGATGDFKEQYTSVTSGLIQLVVQQRSVGRGEVIWAGVESVDADSAVVLVATEGTVANAASNDQPTARNFRLRLSLVREGDRWLTEDLVFIG